MRTPKGAALYIRLAAGSEPEILATTARLGAGCMVSRDAATPVKDGAGKW